jgi:hypothetical protein
MLERRLVSILIGVLTVLLPASSAAWAQESKGDAGAVRSRETPHAATPQLAMTKARACRSIDGYQQYELLPDASLTAEEKLQVYYEPLNFKSVVKDGRYVVHLTQDGQIRRKGEKPVLRKKKNILDFEGKSEGEYGWIFLRNSVALKGLPPGEYEYDIILRDEQNPGSSVTGSMTFRIIAPVTPR